jgi:hypothetical protein
MSEAEISAGITIYEEAGGRIALAERFLGWRTGRIGNC